MNKKEIKGCVHPEDSWTDYGCGDCGENVTYNGCRGPRGNGEKEMIEEMAKDLKECLPNNWYWQKSVDSDTYLVAKHFYNASYRKIPEGSVVLDRQEHQRYCAYKIIEPQIRGCLDRERELERKLKELEEQRDRQAYIAEELIQEKHRWTEQARKETTEKIIDYVYKVTANIVLRDKLAKHFGVEVEE